MGLLLRSRYWFWQFASPSTLLLALLLFPLPWIQLQCDGPRNPPKILTQVGVPKPVADLVAPSDAVVVLTQSGWQAARGECTRDPNWDKTLRQSKASEEAHDRMAAQQWELIEREVRKNLPGSPLMDAYLVVMLAAIALGMALSPGRNRRALLVLVIVTALGLVALQYVVEFPLAQAYRKIPWERLEDGGRRLPPTVAEVDQAVARDLRYTHWFWLAQQLTIIALCLVVAEGLLAPRRTAAADRTSPAGSAALSAGDAVGTIGPGG